MSCFNFRVISLFEKTYNTVKGSFFLATKYHKKCEFQTCLRENVWILPSKGAFKSKLIYWPTFESFEVKGAFDKAFDSMLHVHYYALNSKAPFSHYFLATKYPEKFGFQQYWREIWWLLPLKGAFKSKPVYWPAFESFEVKSAFDKAFDSMFHVQYLVFNLN